MQQRKNRAGRGGQIVFAVLFLAALAAVNYLTFQTLKKTDPSYGRTFLKIVAGDAVLALMALGLSREKMRRVRESKVAAGIVACAGPALALFVVEALLGNLGTMDAGAVLANLAIYYMLFVLFAAIFGKPLLASNLVFLITLIAALAEYFVMEFRGQPITLFDLQSIRTATTVAGTYSYDLTVMAGLLLQGYLGYLLLLHFLKKVRIPRSVKGGFVRLGGAVCSVLCLFLLAQAAEKGTFDFWKINENYQKKGFVYTLLWEAKYVKPEKPEGYSVEEVKAAADEAEQNYTENSQEKNADDGQENDNTNSGQNDIDNKQENDTASPQEKNSDSAQEKNAGNAQETVTQPENLIVIMNESMADFSHIGEVKTDTEIMPFISGLTDNTVKGYVQVPVIGGGTSETEYEFLTGNSKQFLPAGSTAYMIYCDDPEYGIARTLKAQGYQTVAMHPYYAANWNRSTVYPLLGFDEYYSIENWGSETELIRSFTSDASAYEKLIDLVENTDDKLFTFLVTLQNHGSYTEETLNGYEPTVKLDYSQEYPQAETYFSLLNESDKAFEDLVSYFEKSDETTMIVMFGDHFPGVEGDFYTELLGKPVAELGDVEQQEIYQTPYLIWANYDLGAEADGGTISANYLGSYVLGLAGLQETSYDKFLTELRSQVPVVGRGMICDSTGNWYALDNLPEEYTKQVNQYKYLQYYRISDRGDLAAGIYGLAGS